MNTPSTRTNKPSIFSLLVFLFEVTICAITGVTALILAWRPEAGTPGVATMGHGILGGLLLIGCALLYFKPKLGSAILVVTVLSIPVMAALAGGFPAWDAASTASRVWMIVGVIISAGILAAPWLEDRGGSIKRSSD